MNASVKSRILSAIFGFFGGGFLVFVIWATVISIFDLDIENAIPGTVIGALIVSLICFFFPKIAEFIADYL